MPSLDLTKYQALGNDYLVVDRPADVEAVIALAPQICDRHRGVGADGILVFDWDPWSVRGFNPDGSEFKKSGNGLRIAVCHAVMEHDAPDRFAIQTEDRLNSVRVLERGRAGVRCEVDMGPARFPVEDWVELTTPAGSVRGWLVDLGNPHCVVLDEEVSPIRCRELGPHLERHPRFPSRTNVQLAEPASRRAARCQIWERGVGYTLSSGTSATAVAATLMRLGMVEDEIEVQMPGGALTVRRDNSGHMVQAGVASRVFQATIDPRDLAGPLEVLDPA